MRGTTKQAIASLLALLLALAPLQGVMAAVTTSDGAGEPHVMMMADGEPMSHVGSEAVAGSEPCEMADCCNGESCVLGHCVTCFVALNSGSYHFTSRTHEAYVPQFSVQHSQRVIASLFRPPIA